MAAGGQLGMVERGKMAPSRRPGAPQQSSWTTLESAAAQARQRVVAPPASGPRGGGNSSGQAGVASRGEVPLATGESLGGLCCPPALENVAASGGRRSRSTTAVDAVLRR